MLELRDGSPPEIKQKHFVTVIDSLLNALHQILDDTSISKDDDPLDEINKIDKEGYQFKTNISYLDKVNRKPLSYDKEMRQMEYQYKQGLIDKKIRKGIHEEAHKIVLKNIYHTYYDLPANERFRKPDQLMKIVVDGSETLKKVERLHDFGLHPTLIFFSKELFDN